jgi:hypothetical protein
MTVRETIKLTWLPVLVASLCCLTPVVLVLLGLATVSAAVSLTDVLYGQYKWLFRGVGLLLLAGSVALYVRRTKGICTLDAAKRRRSEIVNVSMFVLIVGLVGYGVVYYALEYFSRLASSEY